MPPMPRAPVETRRVTFNELIKLQPQEADVRVTTVSLAKLIEITAPEMVPREMPVTGLGAVPQARWRHERHPGTAQARTRSHGVKF